MVYTWSKAEGHIETSSHWNLQARRRQARVNTYLWNTDQTMFFDYSTATNKQSTYEYATTLYALWCGLAIPTQAALLVSKTPPKFECVGGLTTSTESSRDQVVLPFRFYCKTEPLTHSE